jgi:hypothetical protein
VNPPPTPIVEAEVRFGDGRDPVSIRLPDRGLRPRLRYQRQLALAYHLFMEEQARRAEETQGERPPSRLGAAYARHLCDAYPGCTGVTIRVREHLVPDLVRLRHMAGPSGKLPDPDSPQFYTVPVVVGDFPCDGP